MREDPVDADLLYAGTVTSVYVSFDRGDHWQSLQLNLPTTVVSDMTVHEQRPRDLDLRPRLLDSRRRVAAAAGARGARGEHGAGVSLHSRIPASRARWDNTQDTPLPPEMVVGENPPEGAILDYYLPRRRRGPVTLTITDSAGARDPRILERRAAAGHDDGERAGVLADAADRAAGAPPACTASRGTCAIPIRRR